MLFVKIRFIMQNKSDKKINLTNLKKFYYFKKDAGLRSMRVKYKEENSS